MSSNKVLHILTIYPIDINTYLQKNEKFQEMPKNADTFINIMLSYKQIIEKPRL